MKRHIISYWRPEITQQKLSEDDQFLRELEPNGRITLGRNDEVWIVSVFRESGELYLIGHIIVGQLIELSRALRYRIKAKPGTEEELKYISLMNEAPLLRFQTKVEGADKLRLLNGRVNATQLAVPRFLTEGTAKLLIDKWSEALTKDEIIAQEEERGQKGLTGRPNPLIEEAAIDVVTKHYESLGWSVESVESEKCGYDLSCTKGHMEEHVEVKGLSQSNTSFIITINEYRRAETDSLFRIAIVTKALTQQRNLEIYTGRELFRHFDFQALEYRVTRR